MTRKMQWGEIAWAIWRRTTWKLTGLFICSRKGHDYDLNWRVNGKIFCKRCAHQEEWGL